MIVKATTLPVKICLLWITIETIAIPGKMDIRSDGATSTSTSTSTTSSEAQASSPQSLLDVLKAPPRSSLSRKRTIARNPPRGKRISRGSSTNDPKSVKPAQRVKEYQDESFTVSNCKLFCMGCREEICVKKSSIENHLRSLKHRKGKVRLKQKKLVFPNPWRSTITRFNQKERHYLHHNRYFVLE